MYAVIETGGKQYRVEPGKNVRVETLPGEPGEAVVFGSVLAIGPDGGDLRTGDALGGAQVKGTIQSQGRGDKVLVFKFKRKKQYKRSAGHRQDYTRIKVTDIVV